VTVPYDSPVPLTPGTVRPVTTPRLQTTAPGHGVPRGKLEVMAYYYPQWHRDPTNDAIHSEGWTEWSLVAPATPRFPGHAQPKRPLWGEADEATPEHGNTIVNAALDHGLTGFIVDWYWYDNHPFLNGALDRGLLSSERIEEFRFALMWANHEWTDLYPAASPRPATLLPSPNSRFHAVRAFDHVISRYLTHPSYWRLNGCAYFSIYDLPAFIRGMGGVRGAADTLEGFREAAARAGVGELHLNGVTTFQIDDPAAMALQLRLDSVTHYTWWHHPDAGFDQFPTTPYSRAHRRAVEVWQEYDTSLPVPYIPNVTVGWDPSPRTVPWDMTSELGYPYTSVLVENTPDAVGGALHDAIALVAPRADTRVVTINAWNEWTEGSYLEPDLEHGFGHLQSIRQQLETVGREEAIGTT
jgi:Glycosyltransferase WbsX